MYDSARSAGRTSCIPARFSTAIVARTPGRSGSPSCCSALPSVRWCWLASRSRPPSPPSRHRRHRPRLFASHHPRLASHHKRHLQPGLATFVHLSSHRLRLRAKRPGPTPPGPTPPGHPIRMRYGGSTAGSTIGCVAGRASAPSRASSPSTVRFIFRHPHHPTSPTPPSEGRPGHSPMISSNESAQGSHISASHRTSGGWSGRNRSTRHCRPHLRQDSMTAFPRSDCHTCAGDGSAHGEGGNARASDTNCEAAFDGTIAGLAIFATAFAIRCGAGIYSPPYDSTRSA